MLLTQLCTLLTCSNRFSQSYLSRCSALSLPIVFILSFFPANMVYAQDPTERLTNDAIHNMPMDMALDSDGNPIAIPSSNQSALNYQPQAPKRHLRSHKKSTKKTKRKKSKLSRKQQLKTRSQVANDPSCRWIDQRMDQLEQKLSYSGNNTGYGYHSKELKIRQSEWQCMKCGAEGPSQRDYDNCQYRR
ncbi:hypothetical protein [Shewanella sp. UCD-KL12]|uniref:hypothetical protein n=1 Tax=Shewanella sp. UCD-KL12 TaxID=1917163 RepID=UPI000970A0F2|nr:hypothetical protein [Shewanella sp. UCD-KL12]